MLEDAADVVQAHLRDVRVPAALVEEVLAVLPDRLVSVHARAVVLEERLGHEGGRLAPLLGGVLGAVLVPAHLVGHLRQRVEAHVDLGLPARGHLVMVHLDPDPDRLQGQHHVGADVLELVHGRHREVALLVARLVAEVGPVGRALQARVPGPCFRVDEVIAAVVRLVEPNAVEEEELELGADIDRVPRARLLDVGLGLLGDVAGIARVRLPRDRVLDVADEDHGRHGGERVHLRRRGIGHEEHVRLVDGLEASNGRAVEAEAVLEDALVQLGDGNREVLPEAGEIDEAKIDDLDALLLGHFQHVLRGHALCLLCNDVGAKCRAGGASMARRPGYPMRLSGARQDRGLPSSRDAWPGRRASPPRRARCRRRSCRILRRSSRRGHRPSPSAARGRGPPSHHPR